MRLNTEDEILLYMLIQGGVTAYIFRYNNTESYYTASIPVMTDYSTLAFVIEPKQK